MTHTEHVYNMTSWHRWLTEQLNQECDKMRDFLRIHNPMTYKDLRTYCMIDDKIQFLSQQHWEAEHDLISAAIRYQVPHIKMLQNNQAEDFYTLLAAKAKKIDESEVIIIRKN